MSRTLTTLQSIQPRAEKALFGFPTWTAIDSNSNAASTASVTAVVGYSPAATHMTASFSTAAATALTLAILDGSSTIWQVELAAGTLQFTENFETRPLCGTIGNAMLATLGAAGTSVTATVSMAGFYIRGT